MRSIFLSVSISMLFFAQSVLCSENPDHNDRISIVWQKKDVNAQLGGSLDVGYRYYNEKERADNAFDIFRSRLYVKGVYRKNINFGVEFDFNNTTDHITDAFISWNFYPLYSIKAGKFKVPFGLEWQSADRNVFFAQRSIGNALTPKRDTGLMFSGYLFDPFFYSSLGMFNGTSGKSPTQGRQRDEPEFSTRFILSPFKKFDSIMLESLQFGASAAYCRINLAQVEMEIKSTGMIGSNRNLYVLNPNTKFGVLYDVKKRTRSGLEAFWSIGVMSFQYEYLKLKLSELKPANNKAMDAEFSSGYLSFLLSLTGEKLTAKPEGVSSVTPVKPSGAWLISGRGEYFHGDENWIKKETGISVAKANAISLALLWIPDDFNRILWDYTKTEFSDPLRMRVNTDGTIDYNEKETVFNIRWCIDF